MTRRVGAHRLRVAAVADARRVGLDVDFPLLPATPCAAEIVAP
jgi:hypothetical protein